MLIQDHFDSWQSFCSLFVLSSFGKIQCDSAGLQRDESGRLEELQQLVQVWHGFADDVMASANRF